MAETIKLNIYDNDGNVTKELSQAIVPWGIMKRTMKIAKGLKLDEGMSQSQMLGAMDDESVDNMTALVSDLFGDQVDVKTLNEQADLSEVMSVLTQLLTKIGIAIGNPTMPESQNTTPVNTMRMSIG